MKKPAPIADRFWSKVRKTETCWIWTHSLNRGYGQFSVGHQQATGAHRISWQMHYGAIPRGMYVLHRCDNPPCVRPDHLFLGTHADNMADVKTKGRWKGRGCVDVCKNGHPFNDANTYYRPDGAKTCRVCNLANVLAYKARKRRAFQPEGA